MAKRRVAVTLGFSNWQTLATSWARLYPCMMAGCEHWWTDNHYPLNKEVNRRIARQLCRSLGVNTLDSYGDFGAATAFNTAMQPLGIDSNTIVLGLDPDATIQGPADSFTKAADLLESNEQLAWISLEVPGLRDRIDQHKLTGKFHVCPVTSTQWFEPDRIDALDVTVWSGEFLVAARGVHQQHRYYGQMEEPMYRIARKLGLSYGYMLGAVSTGDGRLLADPEYREWKTAHTSGDKRSFGEWLEGRR